MYADREINEYILQIGRGKGSTRARDDDGPLVRKGEEAGSNNNIDNKHNISYESTQLWDQVGQMGKREGKQEGEC